MTYKRIGIIAFILITVIAVFIALGFHHSPMNEASKTGVIQNPAQGATVGATGNGSEARSAYVPDPSQPGKSDIPISSASTFAPGALRAINGGGSSMLHQMQAEATVDGKPEALVINQIGGFQRINVKQGALIPVQVSYPGAQPGQNIIVEAEDGGQIVESGGPVAETKLDADGVAAFNFQLSNQLGEFRITLRNGSQINELQFWAGPPMPLGQVSPKTPNLSSLK